MGIDTLDITLAQLNPIVGDVFGNVLRIREVYFDAEQRGADLVVTPEMSVTGYPLEDMANLPDLLATVRAALDALAAATKGGKTALVVGAPVVHEGGVYNSALVLADGKVLQEVRKRQLPNYGVFDEKRNFMPDPAPRLPFEYHGAKIGVVICEDAWSAGVSQDLAMNGAEILVAVNASPYRSNILATRVREAARERVRETGLPFVYVNTIGGQDEVVFDGGSFILDAQGRRILQMPQWTECIENFRMGGSPEPLPEIFPNPLANTYRAMMQGLRDYLHKSGFSDVVLGLSGGIDSAVAAAVAADALGPDRVHCVRLPSRYTSDLSNDTAAEMCRIWGFDMHTIPIGTVVEAGEKLISPLAAGGGKLKGLTRENMQARARGFLLMTVSNERGWMLLSTGNKSEIAVGYATLYGDMSGGYNPLKDVYKTTVFALARWRNATRPDGLKGPDGIVIPEAILTRPPSAELAPGQKDSDSLPLYEILDHILEVIVDKRSSLQMLLDEGYDPVLVNRVYGMLKRAEYKRRQGAPGPKTTDRAFSRDRRIPMVNGFDYNFIHQLEELAAMGGPPAV